MSNEYYTSNNISFYDVGELFKKVIATPIKLKGFKQFKFFLHGEKYDWRISEVSTGLLVSHIYDTQEETIKGAIENLKNAGTKRIEAAINKHIASNMLCDKRCGRHL